jgi:hypothetical protein
MEGPYRYSGTMRGEPVSGFAFNERSLALYRDWELIDVLATTVENLSPADPHLVELVGQVRHLIDAGHRSEGRELLQDRAAELSADHAHCRDVVEALIEALAVGS